MIRGGRASMYVKQLSVFIENRKGRLEQVTDTLKKNEVNIVSLSLADTNEYGLLRMIVSDPKKAKEVLRQDGFSAMLTDVLAVKLQYKVGTLQELLKLLSYADLNIEYLYALATGEKNGSMIIKTSDPEKAVQILQDGGMELYDADIVYSINGLI